ncbi:hypothetical protein NST06_10650 [Bacillus sp. FSL P4-0322]|uniref:hypothetical protein n=1 Tax=Bacillus sp. FSL P4-0322 TaxID=2954583 RepID=UPI0030DA2696
MRDQIQEKRNEIKDLEAALKSSKSNTVTHVLQNAIDKRHNEIEELKPNGVVILDVVLKDGTELNGCLLFSVKDRMGSYAVTDTYDARGMLVQEDEVYLQQLNDDFAGNVDTLDITEYSIKFSSELVK